MQKMLDYVEKLDELDTSGVVPLSHIFGNANVFREDVVTNGDESVAMLKNDQKSGTSICIEAPDFFLCILYIRIRNMYNYGSSGVILRPLYILE